MTRTKQVAELEQHNRAMDEWRKRWAPVLASSAGVYCAALGRAPAGNCPSCGAPHEPDRCSYCLTPR